MTLNAFEHIFTDNSEYANYKTVPYFDSLAYTVQEFLYTDKATDHNHDFRMDSHIKLYDFMTLASYFITSSVSDLGRATIKGYIEDMKQSVIPYVHAEKVEYRKECLVVSCASFELILALLWTAYIYADARFQWSGDECWKDAKQILFDLMKEEYGYSDENIHVLPPLMNTDKAFSVMMSHIEKNQIKRKKALPQKADEPQQEEDDEIEFVEIDLHDKVRLDLLLRLIENDGADLEKHGNKMKVATIMQSITGLPLQTCKNYCTNRDLNTTVHSEETLTMNSILQSLGMKIRL